MNEKDILKFISSNKKKIIDNNFKFHISNSISVGEGRVSVKLNFSNEKLLLSSKIQEVVRPEGILRNDFIILNLTDCVVYLTEHKGGQVSHAVDQLLVTAKLVKRYLAKYKISGFVVSNRGGTNLLTDKAKKECELWKKTYKSTLRFEKAKSEVSL